jgi:hypothetical protein
LDPIIGIQRIGQGRNTENWHKIEAHTSKFKEEWELALKKYQVKYEAIHPLPTTASMVCSGRAILYFKY